MKRHAFPLLRELLGLFPCVALLGVRQCGKTTLLRELLPDWRLFDMEKLADHEAIARDPDLFLRLNSRHVAIDESQLLPSLFPALRVAIDSDRESRGRFVITGSSSPELLAAIAESLAGRVAIIDMGPFSLAEAYELPPSPVLAMLAGRAAANDLANVSTRLSLSQVTDYWLHGGYPEPWIKSSPRFRKLWLQNYLQTYLDRDLPRLFPGLDRQKFRLFVQMLAQLSGSIINYSDVARALGVSQPTARDYFHIAHGSFVWRHLPAYEKNAAKRVVKHPKGYLRDSGLLHFLLHLQDRDDLMAHPRMGASWEGMVIENLVRGFAAAGVDFQAFHYRSGGGAEIDLVLEGEFGLLPVEIKHTQHIDGRALRALRDFVAERGCRYGIVINNDERPRLLDDKLIGIPLAAL
ncbi:MAG: ATP-binding protein [Sulfuritalea sp.]|jgi:predicted AAA+ superfamily ATPase|nr:ATP-binding protein [Sulfuritalea sp.]